jgi:O-methyltransferase
MLHSSQLIKYSPKKLLDTRWGWLIRGMPNLRRGYSMFKIRRCTMTSAERSKKLWDLTVQVCRRGVAGSLVECGVWKGGSAGLMALAAQTCAAEPLLHLFDSFEGLPEPQPIDGVRAKAYSSGRDSGQMRSIGMCTATEGEVASFLTDTLGVRPSQLRFHVGWFNETVPAAAASLGPIAILRLDGDWYESTKICLDHLYPNLVKGGIVILDDYYCWQGCKLATDEYREKNEITEELSSIDAEAVMWVKA